MDHFYQLGITHDSYHFLPQVVLKLLLDLGRVAFLKKVSPTFEEDIIKFFNPYQGEGVAKKRKKEKKYVMRFFLSVTKTKK